MRQFEIIRKACLNVASAETACWPDIYKKTKVKSPLFLHCAAVATVVQAIFGGEIVTGRVNGVSHYWNRLPDGIEVDLTSCQFGGDGFTPFKKGRKVKRRKLTNLRFLLFAQRVLENLRVD
jgi:hypothetical protein